MKRQERQHLSSNLAESEQSHSKQELSTWPLPPDLGVFACFHATDPSSAPAWSSSWPEFNYVLHIVFLASFLRSARSHKRARSSLSATASDPRFTDAHSAGASTGLSTSCRSRSAGSPSFSLATGARSTFNLRVYISSAFVNLQTFVAFSITLHLFANPLSTLFRVRVLMSSREQQCQNPRETTKSIPIVSIPSTLFETLQLSRLHQWS